MGMDIGVDFTKNDGAPRSVVLTDWEARLVEHCLGLYLAAAVALDDVTVPLAEGALLKVQLGRVVGGSRPSEKAFRKRERARELRRLERAERDDEIEERR